MIEDILSTVYVPIDNQKGMIKIIESCLRKDGQNKAHSRTLKLDDYREPRHSNLSDNEKNKIKKESIIIILKYFAQKYLADIKKMNADLNVPISLYFPEISNKKITGKDLEYICTHSYDELITYCRTNKKLPLSNFIIYFLHSNLETEHFNSESFYVDETYETGESLFLFASKTNGYSKRIYMNLPIDSQITYEFGLQYVLKCIDRKIPFDMKLIGSISHSHNDLDGTIFYSKNKYFNDHINILNEILEEHPEYKQYIGTPIYTGGHIIDSDGNSYMAIAHAGPSFYKEIATYNDTVNVIINLSYTLACCKLIKYYSAHFIRKLDNNLYKNISNIVYGELNLNTLKQLKEIQTSVRKEVFDFILYKRKQGEINFLLQLFNDYMKDVFYSVVSLVNFGDLEHTDVPIYKNPSFLVYEKNHLKSLD